MDNPTAQVLDELEAAWREMNRLYPAALAEARRRDDPDLVSNLEISYAHYERTYTRLKLELT